MWCHLYKSWCFKLEFKCTPGTRGIWSRLWFLIIWDSAILYKLIYFDFAVLLMSGIEIKGSQGDSIVWSDWYDWVHVFHNMFIVICDHFHQKNSPYKFYRTQFQSLYNHVACKFYYNLISGIVIKLSCQKKNAKKILIDEH